MPGVLQAGCGRELRRESMVVFKGHGGLLQRRIRILAATGAAGLAAAAYAFASAVSAPQASAVSLPDLNPSAPYNLGYERVNGEERLGFASKFVNEGSYKLQVRGRGPSGGELDVQQYIGGSYQSTIIGKMYYQAVGVGQTGHNHWHFRDLVQFELRNLGTDGALVAKGQKQGFCMSDLSSGNCYRGEPNRSEVRMGLSTGATDTYSAQIEGQYIVITNVPAGDYVLRFNVNPARTIQESSTSDNYSSARVRISRGSSGSVSSVRIVNSCSSSRNCS
jgi:Lysyl oxidase